MVLLTIGITTCTPVPIHSTVTGTASEVILETIVYEAALSSGMELC